jgi:hypothetical protein
MRSIEQACEASRNQKTHHVVCHLMDLPSHHLCVAARRASAMDKAMQEVKLYVVERVNRRL